MEKLRGGAAKMQRRLEIYRMTQRLRIWGASSS